MAAPEQPADGSTDVQQAEKRVRLIRVKRKRAADAPEDLVVEGLAAPGKRANTSLSGALAGLGFGAAPEEQQDGGPAGGAAGGAAGEAEPDEKPAVRRQRYRKLSTLSATQLRGMDQQQLSTLLAARQQQQQQGAQQPPQQPPVQPQQPPAARAGIKAAGGATTATAAAAGRAAQHLQAGQAARYEQIRRRRGLSNFSITEHAADPLADLASVYDVVLHDAKPAVGDEQPPSASGTGFGGAAARRPSAAQRAAAAHDEGTLMCNYMPMIREYLASQGRPLLGDGAAAGGGAAAAAAAGQQQQEEAAMEEDDDEYVYDLYAAVPEEGGEGEGGGEAGSEEAWWELHTSGRAPVVQIIDDDNWLVLEGSDKDDSDADSEDSNAEGFYAHDYPDEPSELDSSDDGGHDPEGDTFHRAGGRGSRPWDKQSFGYGSGAGSD